MVAPASMTTPVILAAANDASWVRLKHAEHPGSVATSMPAMIAAGPASPIIPAAIVIARSAKARPARRRPVDRPLLSCRLHATTGHCRDRLSQQSGRLSLLMRIAAQTLQTVAADPKRLGAEIGIVAVLHTWGQAMTHHPHVHCVVPGGGLSPYRSRWSRAGRASFCPCAYYRGCFDGSF